MIAAQCAMHGLDFWISLAEVENNLADKAEEASKTHAEIAEIHKNHQFIVRNLDALVDVLLRLLVHQEEDAEPDAWDVSACAGACFEGVCNCAKDKILANPRLQLFLRENLVIAHANWRRQEAAFLAFGALQEGISSRVLGNSLTTGIPILVHALENKDSKPMVRDSAAWALSRIAEFHFEAIPLPFLAQALTAATSLLCKDVPRVAFHGCTFCAKFASGCEQVYGDSAHNPLGREEVCTNIIKVLLATTKRPDLQQRGLRTAFVAINVVIDKSPTSVAFLLFTQFWPEFVDTLNGTFAIADKIARETSQAMLCASLTETMKAITKVLQTKSPESVNAVVTKEKIDTAMAALIRVLTTPESDAHEEALMAINEIMHTIGQRFTRYMPKMIGILKRTLDNITATDLSRQAAQCVTSVCFALDEAMNTAITVQGKQLSYAQIFVQQLISNMASLANSAVIPSSLRWASAAISALGDLSSVMEGRFIPYLPRAFKVVFQAGKCTLELLHTEDEDLEDAVCDLEEEVITFCCAIMQYVGNANGELDGFMSQIGQYFLSLLRRGHLCPNTIRFLVTGLGDMAAVFQHKCKAIFVDQNGFKPEWKGLFRQTDVFTTDEEMQSFRYAQQMIEGLI